MTNSEHQQEAISNTSAEEGTSQEKRTPVKTERLGPVFLVTISRPEVRNALDGPTVAALTQTFRLFEADETLSVAVLTGAGETFCSGADLSAISGSEPSLRVAEDGHAPLGVSRMLLSKPVTAAVEGHAAPRSCRHHIRRNAGRSKALRARAWTAWKCK